MNVLKIILISFLSICITNCNAADALDNFINSFDEQVIVSEWVLENNTAKLTEREARSIVKNVYSYAYSNNFNPLLILGIIKQESGFNRKAKSFYGAVGLMQVVPRWHRDKLNGRNPFSSTVSIEVGTQILKECFTRFPNNKKKSLSCYSGGAKDYHKKVGKYQLDIQRYVAQVSQPRVLLLASN